MVVPYVGLAAESCLVIIKKSGKQSSNFRRFQRQKLGAKVCAGARKFNFSGTVSTGRFQKIKAKPVDVRVIYSTNFKIMEQ